VLIRFPSRVGKGLGVGFFKRRDLTRGSARAKLIRATKPLPLPLSETERGDRFVLIRFPFPCREGVRG
jgi:hypothetical protein